LIHRIHWPGHEIAGIISLREMEVDYPDSLSTGEANIRWGHTVMSNRSYRKRQLASYNLESFKYTCITRKSSGIWSPS